MILIIAVYDRVKSVVFDLSSSLPPLSLFVGVVCLVCKSVGYADLLSVHFGQLSKNKQSRESVDLPLTCHPFPTLITVAFQSRELLLGVGPYGGTDHNVQCMFSRFIKRTADDLALVTV